MTSPIRIHLDHDRQSGCPMAPYIEITDDRARQIAGLTDLPTRIAALEQIVLHPSGAPVDCPAHPVKTQTGGDEAAVEALSGIIWSEDHGSPSGPKYIRLGKYGALAVFAAIRRGEVPGVVSQQWCDYQVATTTCKKYEDQIAELSGKLAEAQHILTVTRQTRDHARADADKALADLAAERLAHGLEKTYSEQVWNHKKKLIDERDAARAEAEAMAGLLREVADSGYVKAKVTSDTTRLQDRIDAALAKHAEGTHARRVVSQTERHEG